MVLRCEIGMQPPGSSWLSSAFFKRDLPNLEICWKSNLEKRQINKKSNNSVKNPLPHFFNNDAGMKSIGEILAGIDDMSLWTFAYQTSCRYDNFTPLCFLSIISGSISVQNTSAVLYFLILLTSIKSYKDRIFDGVFVWWINRWTGVERRSSLISFHLRLGSSA